MTDNNIEAFEAAVKVSHRDIVISTKKDIASMALDVRAHLEVGIAKQIHDAVFLSLARAIGVGPQELPDFLKFLMQDEALQARVAAWRAKERITR